jgi:hyperosmotically inducible periplasmic protein
MQRRTLKVLVPTFLLLGSFTLLWGQQEPGGNTSADTSASAPDNTKVNKRDRNSAEPTADQQKENKSDRELARNVRRALVKDKQLSTYAHNIKVIAQDGKVVLKGPVRSNEEKQAIEAKAAEVAGGPDKLDSRIEVGTTRADKPSAAKSNNQ